VSRVFRPDGAAGGLQRAQHAQQPDAGAPLVSSSISQHDRLEVFPVSLRVRRSGSCPDRTPPDRSGSQIQGFSKKSRANLRFAAVNACPALISQFGLTYHDQWPTDGREVKRHLNAWLTALRRIIPGVGYLWLLEFQKRNAPHFHVFLTVPPDPATRRRLAEAWCRLTADGDAEALRFHDHPRNWIDWEMNTAGYLCKYLDKEAQKAVPGGYHSFGRFWGASRRLVPKPVEVPLSGLDVLDQFDAETGEVLAEGQKLVIRWLGRLAEKQTRGYSRFRRRAVTGSYTMLQGSRAYLQIERYLSQRRTEVSLWSQRIKPSERKSFVPWSFASSMNLACRTNKHLSFFVNNSEFLSLERPSFVSTILDRPPPVSGPQVVQALACRRQQIQGAQSQSD